ncbi:MAG: sigma-70 family RNA polymerase sigma factor [Verrucomicrobia bacterium]|nr:sigma-70 family RNA polymerase sigma factor [Verrucomicrobiota bacterium]
MSRDEFSQLITDARNSDEAAAKELVERLYPVVIRIVRNHLPRRESEEDLTQEIFLKVFAKLHQYRADMPFGHWVSRISVNTCIDHLRKQRHRPEYRWSDFGQDQQAILENLKNNATEPAQQSPEESRELLNRLLVSLKPAERLVVQWLYLEEKSVAEICDLTGWKASKVKVTAFRARQKLMATVKRLDR